MIAMSPSSCRWTGARPRPIFLWILSLVATACAPAESSKAVAEDARSTAAASESPRTPALSTTVAAPPQRWTPGLPPDPHSSLSAAAQPKVITWGNDPDYFGDLPDKDGYYSARRHFDLKSKDKVRRALVLLDKDADGSTHLRFSKADIEEMLAVEEVLPLVETPLGQGEELLRRINPLLPPIEVTRFESSGEGTASTVERTIQPPVAGYELRLNGDEVNELLELQSVDLATGKILWKEGGIVGPVSRIEFFGEDPHLFYHFSHFRGGGVFDLRTGLRCPFRRDLERNSGIFRPWPSFVGKGSEFQFVEGETIWRIDLANCQIRSAGKIPVPPAAPFGIVDLVNADATSDGSIVLAAVGRSSSAPRSPTGLDSVELEFIRLTLEGESFVVQRRVSARAHNSVLGTGAAVTETCRDPLLVISQFRSRTLNQETGELETNSFSAQVSYFLVRNRFGNFFALRAPRNQGVGVVIDRTRGLVHYGNQWFDLKVLDREETNDFLTQESSSAH